MSLAPTTKPESTFPLVSLCVPTYNGAKFLRESLESAVNQTYPNIEFLLVDDCSTDETLQIASEFPQVKIVKNEVNRGLVGNWNRCLELAQGEFIKFLFQDDLLEPTCVEKMVEASHKPGFIVSRREFIFDESAPPEIVEMFDKELERPRCSQTAGEFIDETLETGLYINTIGEPPCILLRRSEVEKYGNFDASFKQLCDWEYWLRIASHEGVNYIPESLSKFRVHGQSATSKNVLNRNSVVYLEPYLLAHYALTQPRYDSFRSTKRREIESHRNLIKATYQQVSAELVPGFLPDKAAVHYLRLNKYNALRSFEHLLLRIRSRFLTLTGA